MAMLLIKGVIMLGIFIRRDLIDALSGRDIPYDWMLSFTRVKVTRMKNHVP